MATTPASANTEVKRVGKFGLVGILNTLIDYVLFIALTKIFSIPLERVWIAKFVSGAVAMTNSFYLNRKWVFSSHSPDLRSQALRFLLVTLVGVFGIQTGLVQLFSSSFPYFGELAYQIAEALGLTQLLPSLITQDLVIKTVAFGIGTLASMTWNFILYKKVVFRR
jgi:putative flippase GtrA